MPFCELADVKAALRIPDADTTHDARLQQLIDATEAELLGMFHLDQVATQAYTNLYDFFDHDEEGVWLRQYPVVTVTEVKIDGVVQDLTQWYRRRPANLGFLAAQYNGKVIYMPLGRQRLEVTHEAGWAGGVVDASLQMAAVSIVMARWNVDPHLGFDSERIGQYGFTLGVGGAGGVTASTGGLFTDGIPVSARRALSQWVRPFVADN